MKKLVVIFTGVLAFLMLFGSNIAMAGVAYSTSVTNQLNEVATKKLTIKNKKKKKEGLSWFQRVTLKVLGKKFFALAMNKTTAIILTILLSPLVWLWVGLVTDWDKAWWICLLLCFLFFLPGWIYGLIKIIKS